MIRFQLKPRFTQNPCFVSPLRVFSSASFVAMCWVWLLPTPSRDMRMFFFVPISIVVLVIGLPCHSYTFYVSIPHTGGLSIHLLLCRTPFTRATFLCMAFSRCAVETIAILHLLSLSLAASPARRSRPPPWLLHQLMAPSSKHTPQGCLTQLGLKHAVI